MMNDVEYLFIYLLAIWISALKKMFISVFCPFLKLNYLSVIEPVYDSIGDSLCTRAPS